MSSATDLLRAARGARLTVRRDGDRLVVAGPKQAEPLARRLLGARTAVLRLLDAEAAGRFPAAWWAAARQLATPDADGSCRACHHQARDRPMDQDHWCLPCLVATGRVVVLPGLGDDGSGTEPQ